MSLRRSEENLLPDVSMHTVAFVKDHPRLRHPAGLRWRCVRCANSCHDIPGRNRSILLTRRDIERIAGATGLGPKQFSIALHNVQRYERAMRKIEGRCWFLRESRCSIYEARPLICRFYPFSLRGSESGELKIDFDPLCSGIGKGKVRSESFFQSLVRLAGTELSER